MAKQCSAVGEKISFKAVDSSVLFKGSSSEVYGSKIRYIWRTTEKYELCDLSKIFHLLLVLQCHSYKRRPKVVVCKAGIKSVLVLVELLQELVDAHVLLFPISGHWTFEYVENVVFIFHLWAGLPLRLHLYFFGSVFRNLLTFFLRLRS
jgi:hypothetical protein